MKCKKERNIFMIYMMGFLLLASSLALFQPLADTPPLFGNPPDEHARYLVPRYICEYGRIPTGYEEEIRIPAYGFSYALYNAFPYIVQGYLCRFVSLFTDSELVLLYTARFVNVAFGVAMAWVVYLLAARLFRQRGFRWLFCFGIMYFPQNLFLHTYVNTDSCCMLSTAMIVYALVRGCQEGFDRSGCLWLAGGIILCALSYYNAYGYILSSILLFPACFLERKNGVWRLQWREMIKKGAFVSLLVLLGIGWWFLRSYLVLDGDILGLKTRDKMASLYASESVNPLFRNTYESRGISVRQMLRERRFFDAAFCGFVAAFGSMSILGNIWFYRLYKGFLAAGILGYLAVRGRLPMRGAWKRAFFHVNMVFCMAMPVILLIRYAYTIDYQDQGRYLMPMLIPLMYYVTAGLERLAGLVWVPGWMKKTGLGLCLVLLVGGVMWMIYGKAFPVFFVTGMAL